MGRTTAGVAERITVVGSGAWGTTLAIVAARAGHEVTLYVRNPDEAGRIKRTRRNERYLPQAELPNTILVTADLSIACRDTALILLVVPSQTVRQNARAVAPMVGDALVVSAAKGLERGSLKRMSEVVAEELGTSAEANVCALSGPNLAGEIAVGKPATSVVASRNLAAAERARDLLMSPQFRLYTNEDIVGVEMGGALKNIIAIGAGLGDGLHAGDNAKAAFLTRGIAEVARLGIAVGADPLTFAGLAGLGDLVATCASPLSRNHRVGEELVKGRPLAEIVASLGQVAEGIATTEAAYALGRREGVELPIVEQMHAVLFEGKQPLHAVAALMQREAKHELEGIRRTVKVSG